MKSPKEFTEALWREIYVGHPDVWSMLGTNLTYLVVRTAISEAFEEAAKCAEVKDPTVAALIRDKAKSVVGN